jgi:hypothetical protein
MHRLASHPLLDALDCRSREMKCRNFPELRYDYTEHYGDTITRIPLES